jgi:hypothetical protein
VNSPAEEFPVKVADFIDATTATWNEDKLRRYMLPMDVDIILQILLSTRRFDDIWAWHYDRQGAFSVRSAYRMLIYTRKKREAWLDGRSSSSSSQKTEREWSSLWHTQVPSKVKVFLWRLAKQSIPTNDVRAHRGMAESDVCQLCGGADSWRHALIDCTMSRCVWALVDNDITEHMCRSEEGDARLWLARMIDTLKPDD